MNIRLILVCFAFLSVSSLSAQSSPHGESKHKHNHKGSHSKHHSFKDAKKWAKVFDDPQRQTWQRPDEVIEHMQLKPGMTVSDIGAGTGYFLPYLSSAVAPSGMVLALDIEPNLIEHMSSRVMKAKLRNIATKLILPNDPLLEASSQDRILIVNTWHHIENRIAYGKKLFDGLKVGGELHVVDFEPSSARGPREKMKSDEISKELKAAGFKVRLVEENLPDQYIVVGTK